MYSGIGVTIVDDRVFLFFSSSTTLLSRLYNPFQGCLVLGQHHDEKDEKSKDLFHQKKVDNWFFVHLWKTTAVRRSSYWCSQLTFDVRICDATIG